MKYVQPYGVSDPNASYINGNPSTGQMGSIPPAMSIENPQREIVNAITHAGLNPVDADLTQLTKAIQSGGITYAADTGSTNLLAAQLTLTPDLYYPGMTIRIRVANTNTGPASLNLNGLGAKNILLRQATLVGGELLAHSIVTLTYNTDGLWEITGNGPMGSGGGGGPPPTGPVGGFAATRMIYIYNTMTITSAANEIAANVKLWAGGGGGGGANSGGLAAGGGGGEYAEGFFNISPGIGFTCTVGAGGGGGAGTDGQPGGVSAFASIITCGGGQGGYYINGAAAVSVNIPGGSGGSGGGFRVPGGYSGCPMVFPTSILQAQGGFAFAGGMSPLVYVGTGIADNGNNGIYPGGGGGGAYYNAAGGIGAHGFMIVTMYAGV